MTHPPAKVQLKCLKTTQNLLHRTLMLVITNAAKLYSNSKYPYCTILSPNAFNSLHADYAIREKSLRGIFFTHALIVVMPSGNGRESYPLDERRLK